MLNVCGKEYPKFLLDEVMPFINREYRTDTDPARLGLVALLTALVSRFTPS